MHLRRSLAHRIVGGALAMLVVSACATGPAGQSASMPTDPPTSAPTSTASPRPTAIPTLAITSPTPPSVPSPEPYFSPPDHADPPAGTLVVGDEAIDGSLGSYCYGSTCLDGPGPPKAQLPRVQIGIGGEEIEFRLGAPARFIGWSVVYFDKSDSDEIELASNGLHFDPDTTPATPWPEITTMTFPAPPAGNWVLEVHLRLFSGDLHYAWHVIVR